VRRRVVLLGLVLTACAAAPPATPLGDLPRSTWPVPPVPRAVVLAVHGFNDHHTAFAGFAAAAAARGVMVVAYDQRGFGANPDRGHWAGTEVLVADLRGEIERLRQAHPDTPLFVLGESMGAAVSVLALTGDGAPEVRGVVLSAPAVWGGSALNPFYRSVLWLLRQITPALTLTGRGLGKRPTDNEEVLRELASDPLFIKETRVDAIGGLVDLMGAARAQGPLLRVPSLVLVGKKDEIVPVETQLSFAATLPPATSKLIVYPDGWHLLLRDLQRERVWADVLGWIDGILAAEHSVATQTQPPSAT
jgi:alpha-beta hydrolase superfamily lysophospholipase